VRNAFGVVPRCLGAVLILFSVLAQLLALFSAELRSAEMFDCIEEAT
jgi:hypothetical protein